MSDRYANLLHAVDATAGNNKDYKIYRIMEIGTYRGDHAAQMILRASERGRKHISYHGFDLFEDMTPELSIKEKSKTKLPPSLLQVAQRLANIVPGVGINLHKGFTSVTLPKFGEHDRHRGTFWDLIFIDGGHSLETIANDWQYASLFVGPKTVVIFDDYYPDREDYGCKKLITELQQDPRWKVEMLEPVDNYPHTGVTVQFVKVTKP